jgi:LysR family hydrogen peroxide-inducible transcriptional activator
VLFRLEAASLLVGASDEIVVSNLLQSFASDTRIAFEVHAATRDTLLEMVALGMGSVIVGASSAASRPNIACRALDCQEAAINVGGVRPSKDSNPLRHRLVDCIRRNSNSAFGAPRSPCNTRPRGKDQIATQQYPHSRLAEL